MRCRGLRSDGSEAIRAPRGAARCLAGDGGTGLGLGVQPPRGTSGALGLSTVPAPVWGEVAELLASPTDRPTGVMSAPDQLLHLILQGWEAHGASLYYFSHVKKSWHEAERFCVSQGAHLASVTSEEEQVSMQLRGAAGRWGGALGLGFPPLLVGGARPASLTSLRGLPVTQVPGASCSRGTRTDSRPCCPRE